MPLHVVSVLALLSIAAGYTKRPSFKKPFPDPSLFHKSGRRLAAEGQKPERLHFEVEDGGYHFDYDFGGIPTIERVFNLDSQGVEGISCTRGHAYHNLTIFWSNLALANAANLQKDVVITGSPEWGCSLSNASRKSSHSSDLVLRILKVDSSALGMLRTELHVLPVSPVQLFRNLYIDLSWYPLQGEGRHLQESCGDYTYGLNYDCQTQKAKDVYSIGPLACSNCYAALKATPGFQVETDNLGVPTKIALDLSATFEVNFEVRFSPSSDGSWKSLFSGPVSDNLIDKGLTFTMPLFGSLVSAINEWTVNIGIYITYQLKGQADPQSTLEGVFQTRQVFQWSGAQVAWTKGTGLSTELGTVSFNGSTVTPDLRDFAADLRGALAPCAGLEFNYGDETMSAVSSCLEGHVAYATEKAETSVAASAVAATAQASDETLCVDMYQFETDGDLDSLPDKPYAGWCFFGKCHYRSTASFSGSKATWDDGEVCMDIQSAWLATNKLYMEVWEWNVAWDKEYIERISEDLSDDIGDLRNGVDWTLTPTPTSKSGGTYAKVLVKVKLTSKRLLQTSNASSCGQSLHVGPGLHGGLSGFVLPASWENSGEQLVGPIEMPSYHGEMELALCEDLPRWDPSGMWGSSKGSGPTFLDGLLIAWSLFA